MGSSDNFMALLPILVQYLPELIALLKGLFGGSASNTDAAITAILAMRLPEQIEADVDGGQFLPEPWGSRRTISTIEKGAGDVFFGLIVAQAATGTHPDGMTDEEFAEKVAAANAAHVGLVEAYRQCIAAIGELREDAYVTAQERLVANLAELGKIKAEVCPFIN